MKRDTAANWEQNNPVLLNGEIIIVDTASGEVRFKIGDGTKLYKQLPFSDEAVRALISAKEDKVSLTENRAVISDASGKLSVSEVTSTELSYLDGVSSNLQTQLNNKVPTTRKINSKPLSSDITLNASDVHALPDTTTIPSKTSQLTNDSNFVTQSTLNDGLNGKLDKADAGSDWNQNDETQPDYVKNRPFYTGDPVETVMLPETTVTIVANSENLISSSFTYSFEVGQTYVITFDGVDTEYTAYEVQGLVFVGDNFSSVSGGSGYVVMANNGSIVLSTLDSSLDGSHTIAIKIYNQEIVKVDEKYLPESAFTDAEWSKISNKIVDYKQQSLSLSVSGEQILIRAGNSYSKNKINDNLKFEDGIVYEINGSITLHSSEGGNASVLNINGHYTCSKIGRAHV